MVNYSCFGRCSSLQHCHPFRQRLIGRLENWRLHRRDLQDLIFLHVTGRLKESPVRIIK